MTPIRVRTALPALAALLGAVPFASAQAAGDAARPGSVSLVLGGLGTDVSEGKSFGMAAARAEVRLRYDQQQFSGQEFGAETTVGLSLRM